MRVKLLFGFLLLIFTFITTIQAEAVKTEIVVTKQVKEYIGKLSPKEQQQISKAIKVGNGFAELYLDGMSVYDEEIEDEWNKRFNPMMTLSGDEWRKIWIGAIGDDKKGFGSIVCDKAYLKNISFDRNTTKLLYEALVFGMDNEQTTAPYQFIKLNERLIFEVIVGRAMKITDVRFLTKNSDIHTKKNRLSGLYNSLKQLKAKVNKSMTVVEGFWRERQRMQNDVEQSIKSTEEASSICKDY